MVAPTNQPPTPVQVRRVPSARRAGIVGVSVGALALGLLIWAKLRLVTGVPRTAIAVPERVERPNSAGDAPLTDDPGPHQGAAPADLKRD